MKSISAENLHDLATQFLEAKLGLYVPGVFTALAPEEATDQAKHFLNWLEQAQTGQSYAHD